MSNSIVIVFEASKFDGTDEVCSIWTKCDCVSYQKFVVKWPPLQPRDSLLQKCVANQMSWFTFKSNLNKILTTETKKLLQSISYFAFLKRIEISQSTIFQILEITNNSQKTFFNWAVSFIWSKYIIIEFFISKFLKIFLVST